MLALAVLATVAAGAVEVQPRSGWREPLCLFVAVGMDAGARKSSVFTALTRPVAEFERHQATAALPAITETITLRRIADQAAAHAEAASKAPADLQEERQAEAIARAAEAANLIVPPVPRWLVDDATPEALAGLLATYGRIALLSPEGTCSTRWPAATARPPDRTGVYLKGHAGDLLKVDRRGRPPEYVERPCSTSGWPCNPRCCTGWLVGPGSVAGGQGRGSLTASPKAWSAAASPAPHPSQRRWLTATPWNSKPWLPAHRSGRQRPPGPARPRPGGGAGAAAWLRA